jgi:protein-S-isoprenylcysteine O-methyltransferase Ste14
VAVVGIVLQGLGYFLVWFQPPHQPFLQPVAALSGVPGIAFAFFAVGLAVFSVWLVGWGVRTLGKQWAFRARLVEGHKLVTDGPYAYIRNPIYTGMLGMLITTGLATEHWIALIPALVFFAVGMLIRIRSEERLLRAEFGEQFDEYASRVPAVLPGIF